MRIGVDYYPEHWPEEVWEQDADRMQDAGVSVVRMAEFAWSRLEPEEGVYEFGWLDRAVQVFTERGIDIVLCTPTCTPPQWMFHRYPEVIQVGRDGNKIPIGVRGHRCMSNLRYRDFCDKIISRMVGRYCDNPNVIGYQIDNELEANHCRCPECVSRFRKYVQEKYHTIDAVNRAYGNAVWSGEYSCFEEIEPPTAAVLQWQNPSLTLDYNRYASESTVDYVRFQEQIIRELAPDALITTNNWLCENMPDFYDMFETLDVVSYDNYPALTLPKDRQTLYSHAFHLDLMRGIKRQNFWIMEQLSGAMGSWMPMTPTLYPGMLEGYSLQAFAHGADTVIQFRFRTACSGAEMYWHGLLDHSNMPGRRYKEFEHLCRRAEQLEEVRESEIISSVAVLYGSDQEYAFKLQHQAEGMYYLEQLKSLHDAFTAIGMNVDIIDEKADLSGYDIVLAPTLQITNEIVVQQLYQFVAEGGTVVLTNRCGVKDMYNKCQMDLLPTVYRELVGVHVEEYDVIGTVMQDVCIQDDELRQSFEQTRKVQWQGEPVKPCATQWCDLLKADTAEVLAVYQAQEGSREAFYRGTPVVTRNEYGTGEAYYLGTVLDRASYISLAKTLAKRRQLEYDENLPLGMEVTTRVGTKQEWRFWFNNTMQTVCLQDGKTFAPFEMKVAHRKRGETTWEFYPN